MTSPILEAMNPRQLEAVTAPEGPVLVVAGPGSGKTRVLTHRIAYMIDEYQIPAYRIMAVTFTNKAANEMRMRVAWLVGGDIERITLGTFHRICAQILRREAEYTPFTRDFVIADTQDQVTLIKQILIDLQLDSNKHQPYSVLNQISAAKNELIPPDHYPTPTYDDEVVRRVYHTYIERLRGSNSLDFDDLLMQTVELLRNHPDVQTRYHHYFSHILVDEFQDTNMAQYELIRLMTGPERNVFVVGDPDQSIYAFRGADYRNIKRFQDDFSPTTILLEENYRSHQIILDAATAIIRKNLDHIQRDLFSQRKTGPKIQIHEGYSERHEAQYVLDTIQELVASGQYQRREIAVLYRLNSQSRVLEEMLVRANIPYVLVGATRFYGRREVKDALSFLRVIHNPQDESSMRRIINVPARGIGSVTIGQLFAWSETFIDGIWGAFQAVLRGDESPLGTRALNVIRPFAEMIVRLHQQVETSTPLELLDAVLEESGYLDYLQSDRSQQGTDRIDNIAELRRVAHEFSEISLAEFLTDIALVSEVDTLDKVQPIDAVTLLTLHAAKGLEFRVVMIIGMEEGILPHHRALDDEKQMAEERRLMYVGVTRAKDSVYLAYVSRRFSYGLNGMTTPSRFLQDLPPDITLGRARIPQPQSDSPYYQRRWETDWQPSRVEPERQSKRQIRFKKGQQVQHKGFGKGIIVNIDRSADVEIVEVLFQGGNQKRLDSSYVQPIEEE